MNPGWQLRDLKNWLAALSAGEVVAAPAEGVYGYCRDPFSEAALRGLVNVKQRDPRKGLIVLIRHERELVRYTPRWATPNLMRSPSTGR